ncbi:hypothetical protein ACFFSH_40420 [Streptomyces filamentosus]|uniref:Uncharacterized protein n=1 Tax=Streptomyces filamentosus TaxID=67294 RepID=A0A919BVH1_STRFL|nr:hypothetical protein [Streptomyces filamentosus]GHG15302.1 hypothetical protein GCM10017667_56040 [Streptomyces filamentosus]
MNPNKAAGEGLSGRVSAEQGTEVVGEGRVAPGPQKGTQSLEVVQRLAVTFQTRLDAARDWARRNLPADQRDALLRVLRGDATAGPANPSDSEQYARDIECAIGLNSGGTGPDMVHAVRDAVLRVRDQQLTEWRREAIRRGLAVSRLQGVIQALEELAAEEVTHRGEWGNGYRDAQNDLREVLDTLQSSH